MTLTENAKATVTDLLWRSFNTFWEAFSVVMVVSDWPTLKVTGVAAMAAGVAAVRVFISAYIKERVA